MAAARTSRGRWRMHLPNATILFQHLKCWVYGGLCFSPSQIALYRQLAGGRQSTDEPV